MAKMFERNPTLVRGRRILELGAGTGLLGMTAHKFGASECLLTELPSLLPTLEAALATNGCPCRVAALDWNDPGRIDSFDLILASDCLICEQWAMGLAKVLQDIPATTQILVGTARDRDGIPHFLDAMMSNFHVSQLPQNDFHPDFFCNDIVVFDLKRK